MALISITLLDMRSSAAQQQTCAPASVKPGNPKLHGAGKLTPLVLLICALLGGAGAELFGPAPVRQACQNLSLAGAKGQSAMLAAFIAALITHECGHLIAAFLVDFRIIGIAFGPLRFSRMYGQSSWQFKFRNSFTGAISAIPREDGHWRARMLIVIAAGPVATLLSAIFALALSQSVQTDSWLLMAYSSLACLNLLIFFLGLVPNGTFAATRNDAQLFWCILRDGDEAEEIKLYHQLTRQKIKGTRPRDYPPALIDQVTQHHQGRPDICLAFADALMKHAIDRKDLTGATAWHNRMLAHLENEDVSPLYNLARAEVGCFDLAFHKDAPSAQKNFSRVLFEDISPVWLRYRMIAASRAAEGRRTEATEAKQHALASLPNSVAYSGFERMVLEQL